MGRLKKKYEEKVLRMKMRVKWKREEIVEENSREKEDEKFKFEKIC